MCVIHDRAVHHPRDRQQRSRADLDLQGGTVAYARPRGPTQGGGDDLRQQAGHQGLHECVANLQRAQPYCHQEAQVADTAVLCHFRRRVCLYSLFVFLLSNFYECCNF